MIVNQASSYQKQGLNIKIGYYTIKIGTAQQHLCTNNMQVKDNSQIICIMAPGYKVI